MPPKNRAPYVCYRTERLWRYGYKWRAMGDLAAGYLRPGTTFENQRRDTVNRIYRSIWNDKTGTFVAASEISSSCRKSSSGATAVAGKSRFALKALAVSLMLAFGSNIYALPTGGTVSAGSASIAGGVGTTTINQSSQNVAINWQGFNIGAGEAVRFVQPNSNSAALNRVLGPDPSSILGSLSANGKVFLVNPNGILFGRGAQVNVGGLVASTRGITDSDFMAGNYKFAGSGGGTIVNQGSITADGGYVALLGASVNNEGVISARLGTVALAAGNAFTLDVAGDGLLNVMVNEGAVNALVQNGGMIRADGGQVLLTALSAGTLLQSAVNNTGVIQAQTIENHNGTIRLMGDMQSGTVNVGGTLDASAPNGGNGGFIETSAAHVKIANDVNITTAAPKGVTGTFLIDPLDFNIGAGAGDDIRGTTLAALLVTNSVVISTVAPPPDTLNGGSTPPLTSFNRAIAGAGNGDINVNESIGGAGPLWTAAPNTTTLTLNALRDVNINQSIVATNGTLVVCCGRDINVIAAITTTNGSVLLSAGNDINLLATGAMTTTNGNMTLCAGHDVNVIGKITLTQTTGIVPSQSLGLARGLVLSAGNAATGPGAAGGTVILPLVGALRPSVTGESAAIPAPVTITYNPVSYLAGGQTDYSTSLILVDAVLTQFMLVHPGGADKTFDGTTTATFTGLQGNPAGVTLNGGGVANFANTGPGLNIPIAYTGFGLTQGAVVTGGTGLNFALPTPCCGVVPGTTGNIAPAVVVVPPAVLIPGAAALTALAPESPQFEFAPLALQIVPGINLTSTGIRMPPIQLAEAAPVPTEALGLVPPPVEVVPPVPPAPLPPRRDRN